MKYNIVLCNVNCIVVSGRGEIRITILKLTLLLVVLRNNMKEPF